MSNLHRFREQEELQALHKLSELQQDILLRIFSETSGCTDVKWTPGKWFEPKSAAKRSTLSKSIDRIEERGLIKRQVTHNNDKVERTSLVGLTNLGYRVCKRLTNRK